MFSGSSVDPPVIREWFVYPGNPLKEPDLVPPAQLSLPRTVSVTELKNKTVQTGTFTLLTLSSNHTLNTLTFVDGRPSLDLLWFGAGSDVSSLRLMTFLAIFDCQEFSDLHGTVEVSLLAALCLVTYIVRQVMLSVTTCVC